MGGVAVGGAMARGGSEGGGPGAVTSPLGTVMVSRLKAVTVEVTVSSKVALAYLGIAAAVERVAAAMMEKIRVKGM